jgi:hypothetical protein
MGEFLGTCIEHSAKQCWYFTSENESRTAVAVCLEVYVLLCVMESVVNEIGLETALEISWQSSMNTPESI